MSKFIAELNLYSAIVLIGGGVILIFGDTFTDTNIEGYKITTVFLMSLINLSTYRLLKDG